MNPKPTCILILKGLLFGALISGILTGCLATAPVSIPQSELRQIEAAASNVPKECAAFLGGWAGTWPNGNFGQLRLWVTSVNSSCEATYNYNGRGDSGLISKGTLSVPCGGGTCYFSNPTDGIDASYSQSSFQRTRFGKIVGQK